MPFVTTSHNTRIFWRLEGQTNKPALLLSNSLGCDHLMWQAVMPALLARFQVLRYDTRGHGASDAPAGDYSLAQLASDALAVADAAQIKQFHFCGLSLGAMTGMELALAAPEQLLSLSLTNTSANIPSEVFQNRINIVQQGGMAAVADAVMGRFFSDAYRSRVDAAALSILASTKRTLLSTSPAGYASCCAAIRDMQLSARIAAIKLPALVLAGKRDMATPPAMSHDIVKSIAGAVLVELDAAHISALELPAQYAQALIRFALGDVGIGKMAEEQRFALGMQRRSAILGDAYVQKSVAGATDFNREWQQFITQTAWGSVWTRGVMSDETRRLLVLAMTATGARWEEFRLHLRAALDSGLEEVTLQEVLMQIAIYSGVPAANTAYHLAAEALHQHRQGS